MNIILTAHAKQRMAERSISEELVWNAVIHPTKTSRDHLGRLLIKKLYRKQGSTRLLLIAGERHDSNLRIFTIIDTSKVNKYL